MLEDTNGDEYLDKLRTTVLERLSRLAAAPSVPFQERPPDAVNLEEEFEVRVVCALFGGGTGWGWF